MPDEMKDIKKLSPEERIKKLKELEEKSKKEIAEAQKLIKQSEGEIEQENKFKDKVPIPQLIAEEERTLESQEAKEMFESQREISKSGAGKVETKKKEVSLEEQLRKEHIENLAQKPAEQLKEMMADIYKRAGEQGGYMNKDQQEEVYSINRAEQGKIYAMKSGEYPADQMAGALENISATFAMGKQLRKMYEAKGDDTGGGSNYQN